MTPERHSVIMDTGSTIMKAETVDRLADYANAGGKLILFADSGKTDFETGSASRPLLTRLGFVANSWSTRGSGLQSQVLPANGVFEGISQLKLSEQVYVEPQMDVPFTVLAQYDNGKPAAVRWSYGAGEVVLILGTLDWYNSKGLIDALSGWGGFERTADADSGKVRVSTRSLGDERIVFAYYRPWFSSANLSQAQMNAAYPQLTSNVKIMALAAAEYDVYDVTGGGDLLGRYTAAQMNGGMPLTFQPGELRILRLLPVTTAYGDYRLPANAEPDRLRLQVFRSATVPEDRTGAVTEAVYGGSQTGSPVGFELRESDSSRYAHLSVTLAPGTYSFLLTLPGYAHKAEHVTIGGTSPVPLVPAENPVYVHQGEAIPYESLTPEPIKKLVLNDFPTLAVGDEGLQIEVSTLYEDGTSRTLSKDITYESNHEEVAIVSSSGRITPVGHGTSVITVTYGGYRVSRPLHVDIRKP